MCMTIQVSKEVYAINEVLSQNIFVFFQRRFSFSIFDRSVKSMKRPNLLCMSYVHTWMIKLNKQMFLNNILTHLHNSAKHSFNL